MRLSLSRGGILSRLRSPAPGADGRGICPCKTIVVVGSPELRPPLEDVVDPGAYTVVFVESLEGAHARIVQAMPTRVIVCCDVDDMEGFQLLSMLKADQRTRAIPAVTYLGYGGVAFDAGLAYS